MKDKDFFQIINDIIDKDVIDLSLSIDKSIRGAEALAPQDNIKDKNDNIDVNSELDDDLDVEDIEDTEDIEDIEDVEDIDTEKDDNSKNTNVKNKSKSFYNEDEKNVTNSDNSVNNNEEPELFVYKGTFLIKRRDGKSFVISEAQCDKISADGLQDYKISKLEKGESFDEIDLKTYARNIIIKEILPVLYNKTYAYLEKIKQGVEQASYKKEDYLQNIQSRGAELVESEQVVKLNNILEEYGAISGILVIYATGEVAFFVKIDTPDIVRRKTWKREKLDELEDYKKETKDLQLKNKITFVEYKNRVSAKEKEIESVLDNPGDIPADSLHLIARIVENATEKIIELTDNTFVVNGEKRKFRKKSLKQRLEEVQKALPPFSKTGTMASRSDRIQEYVRSALYDWIRGR